MTLETRPALSRAARPTWPLPQLLLIIVRFVAPWSISAWMSSIGLPASPKPPNMMVAPSKISETASAALAPRLSIILQERLEDRRYSAPVQQPWRGPEPVRE